MNTLQIVAKDIYKRAKKLQARGQMPLILGIDGLIALTWDKFQRHMNKKEELELLDAAALALLVYHAAQAPELNELAKQTWEEEDPNVEDDPPEDITTLPLCPRCGIEDNECTIIPRAEVPICDPCVDDLGDPEAYQEWLDQFQAESSDADDDIE